MITTTCQYCEKSFQTYPYVLREGKGKYCSGACYGMAKTQAVLTCVAQRFAQLVDNSGGADTCWPWMGKRTPDGYGILYHLSSPHIPKEQRFMTTHRYAYERYYGPIPPGMLVCHRCDNPPCCNAARCLFLGTYADNAHDAMQKGRFVGGKTHGRHTSPESFASYHGETHPGSKLTEIQAREILSYKGTMSISACAALYPVSDRTIMNIWHRTAWKHLDVPDDGPDEQLPQYHRH